MDLEDSLLLARRVLAWLFFVSHKSNTVGNIQRIWSRCVWFDAKLMLQWKISVSLEKLATYVDRNLISIGDAVRPLVCLYQRASGCLNVRDTVLRWSK